MKDLAISLENRPGALAAMGEALGRAGVSIEGGGAWVTAGTGIAHFLFEDGTAARRRSKPRASGLSPSGKSSFSDSSRTSPASSVCSHAGWRRRA